eukprot:CAMPEP_0114563626 /NCGR_PEP_ID=MMETSP0114-20121206/13221_1 /TAXON_ID=31324 /ORGANISM="Goniomonas sp, Strain m" /LENGTH=237 /DNA_ID=CAMNT_0001749507 /DNA_START=10 /DNA_END=723 /DNA_ORIENTATION=+
MAARILFLALLGVSCVTGVIRDMTFEKLETEPGQKVVLFCTGSGCDEPSKILEETSSYGDAFEYVRIDCAADGNKEKCGGAGFTDTVKWFTNTAEGGIEPYSGPTTAQGIKDSLAFRMTEIESDFVVEFESKEQFEGLKGYKFVKFFQTWCGHCKTMKKHWQKASQDFPPGSGVYLLDVDCGTHGAFCQENGVGSYPTLKLFKPNGEVEAYKGGRTYFALGEYLSKLTTGGSDKTEL